MWCRTWLFLIMCLMLFEKWYVEIIWSLELCCLYKRFSFLSVKCVDALAIQYDLKISSILQIFWVTKRIQNVVCIPLGFPPWWLSDKESACQCGRCKFNPWFWRSCGEGNGYPLQDSWLGNPIYRGAWRATVQGVTLCYIVESNETL